MSYIEVFISNDIKTIAEAELYFHFSLLSVIKRLPAFTGKEEELC